MIGDAEYLDHYSVQIQPASSSSSNHLPRFRPLGAGVQPMPTVAIVARCAQQKREEVPDWNNSQQQQPKQNQLGPLLSTAGTPAVLSVQLRCSQKETFPVLAGLAFHRPWLPPLPALVIQLFKSKHVPLQAMASKLRRDQSVQHRS